MTRGRSIRTCNVILSLSFPLLLTYLVLPVCATAEPPRASLRQWLEDPRFDQQAVHRLDHWAGQQSDHRQDLPGLRFLDSGDNGPVGGSREGDMSGRNNRIVGTTLFASGIFLCSWGITEWEIQEYQCCPARNTGNVVKIVAGIVLINAGLMYLLGVND